MLVTAAKGLFTAESRGLNYADSLVCVFAHNSARCGSFEVLIAGTVSSLELLLIRISHACADTQRINAG